MHSRVGQVFVNNKGLSFTIIEYVNCSDVLVQFASGCITHTTNQHIKSGKVKDYFQPIIYSKGFLGKPRGTLDYKAYRAWHSMLRRCYYTKSLEKYPTYVDVEVCEEWLNFATFETWFLKNYVEGCELDKDTVKIGNKLYCPDYCKFVPRYENAGIKSTFAYAHKVGNKFKAAFTYNHKRYYLGYFATAKEAKEAVLAAKRKLYGYIY